MKPLERIFFMSCLHEQMRVYELSKREFSVRVIGNIFERLGFSYKQLMYYVDKWEKRGFYEYGVSFDLGWFVLENLTGEYKAIYEQMKNGTHTPWRDMQFAEYIVKKSVGTKYITNYSLKKQLGIGEDREFYDAYKKE